MKCWSVPQFESVPSKIRVALPACPVDAYLMMANLGWQEYLDGRKDFDCVLSIDSKVDSDVIEQLETLAWRTFSEVQIITYPTAPIPVWPNGPNWAFQQTARYMSNSTRAWYWMESDCFPIRSGWLDVLNSEYQSCGKPMMGPIVQGMGHCNGTAIYPANFPRLSPASMTCTYDAWDGVMCKDTIHLTHNASHLMYHIWGIKDNKAMPCGGSPAHFGSWEDVERWVDPNAVVIHRCKDTSFADRMFEKFNQR